MTATEQDAAATSSRRSSVLVAAGILLSRISGLIRQAAFGHFLGAGLVADAFTTALRIPNLLQNLLGEGVLSASFIPVYARLLEEGDEEEAGRVAGAIAGMLALVSSIIVLVGVVFAGPITDLFAWGLSSERRDLTVRLVRIMTPGVGVLVLSAWCLGVLNSHRQFFLSYVAPVLWNVAQIAALVAFGLTGTTGEDLATVLAWAMVAGSVLQFGVQLPAVRGLVPHLRLSLDRRRESVRKVVRAFVPIVSGRGVVQLMAYVDLAIASFLAFGAIAVLGFAQTLYLLPISLFGMAVAAAELPELSRAKAAEREHLAARINAGLARIAFFVVGSVLVFVFLGDLLVEALFGYGQFGDDAVRAVHLVLVGYCLGLVGNTSSRLYQSALYGSGEARLPAIAAGVRVGVSAVFGALLMFQLDRVVLVPGGGFELIGDLPAFGPLDKTLRETTEARHLGAVGLAIAAGMSAWIETAILRRRLEADLERDLKPGGGQLGRTVGAAVVAVPVAFLTRALFGGWPAIPGALAAIGVTGGVYVTVAAGIGVGEARDLLQVAQRRVEQVLARVGVGSETDGEILATKAGGPPADEQQGDAPEQDAHEEGQVRTQPDESGDLGDDQQDDGQHDQ